MEVQPMLRLRVTWTPPWIDRTWPRARIAADGRSTP